jgi:hypothetical protein
MGYLVKPNVIARVLTGGRQEGQGQRRLEGERERFEDTSLLSLKMEQGSQDTNLGQRLNAGKGEDRDCPLKTLRGAQHCQTLIWGFLASKMVRQ